MATRPLLYLCAYVLLLSTAAWATQSQQMVWGVGLLSALAFVGRAGTCRDCGQWVAVARRSLAPAPIPRHPDAALAVRPTVHPPAVPALTPRTTPRKTHLVQGKRPVPILRFAGRIDHV